MQRRLAVAFVLTALVSIVLVGFGILAIARVGATNRAESQVLRGLNVVGSLLESEARPLRQLQALPQANRRDLGLDALEAVIVSDDGRVDGLARGSRARTSPLPDLPDVTITDDAVARLDAGDTVLVDAGGTVVGLRAIPFVVDGDGRAGPNRLALLAADRPGAVPAQSVNWFVLSSGIVLVGALVAGILLARRMVTPIRSIEAATAAIAAGDLATRVAIAGDDEVADLGRSVNRMAADLERSKALDQQFLLSVSHDLRTPLTAIAGYAEALRDGAADPGPAGEVIGNHAARLDRLVGDLLDLAKLDANRFRLDPRPVDLAVVAGRTAAGLAASAAQDGVAIEARADGPTPIVADADRLAQAIGNVVANAVTFAERLVTVGVTTSDGHQAGAGTASVAVVAVVDDGPGFDPEDLPFVFDRLYTGRARPRRAENPTGLGLAIVRELVGAMGGAVQAANVDGGGACITLSFPLDDQPVAADPAAPVPGVTATGSPRPERSGPPPSPPGSPGPSPSA